LENGESVMKLVYALRRKGETLRQRLGEQYPSWYLDNAGSHAVQEMKRAHEDEIAGEQQQHEEELQRERELDEDVPILTLKTTGKFQCITPDCPYRFDTRELMYRHFDDCFAKAVEEMPTDPQDALDEEFADAFDDECGVLPGAVYPWFEEDEAEGRWEQYSPENADGGMMRTVQRLKIRLPCGQLLQSRRVTIPGRRRKPFAPKACSIETTIWLRPIAG
jgi:hypothetical protein